MATRSTKESGWKLRIIRRIDRNKAGIAQLVEHDLAKVGVASSSLVSRSSFTSPIFLSALSLTSASTAEVWLRNNKC